MSEPTHAFVPLRVVDGLGPRVKCLFCGEPRSAHPHPEPAPEQEEISRGMAL